MRREVHPAQRLHQVSHARGPGWDCIHNRVLQFARATSYLTHALFLLALDMLHQMRENLLQESSKRHESFTPVTHKHPSLLHRHSSFIQRTFTQHTHTRTHTRVCIYIQWGRGFSNYSKLEKTSLSPKSLLVRQTLNGKK